MQSGLDAADIFLGSLGAVVIGNFVFRALDAWLEWAWSKFWRILRT